jgi:hypothetical protein
MAEHHSAQVRRLAQEFTQLAHTGVSSRGLTRSEAFDCEQHVSQRALKIKLEMGSVAALGYERD